MALTILHRPCLVAVCDGCHLAYDQDEGTVHFESFSAAADHLAELGWLVRPDAVLCTSCAEPEDPQPLPEELLAEVCGAVELPEDRRHHG